MGKVVMYGSVSQTSYDYIRPYWDRVGSHGTASGSDCAVVRGLGRKPPESHVSDGFAPCLCSTDLLSIALSPR